MTSGIKEISTVSKFAILRNEILQEAMEAVHAAKLPDHFQWGQEAQESFEFGKTRAMLAIAALKIPVEHKT